MLLDHTTSLLIVVDFQEKLLPALDGGEAAISNGVRLLKAARRLDVPIVVTEQYPEGLGHSDPRILSHVEPEAVHEKTCFNSSVEEGPEEAVARMKRRQLVLCGAEAHVCVLQTAIGFREAGHDVAVVADAVASRAASDKTAAISRLSANGVEIVSTEMALFEWIGRAATAEFRDLLPLIK